MNPLRIAVDVESGDNGRTAVIDGVMEACAAAHCALQVVLCGDRDATLSHIENFQGQSGSNVQFSVEHCTVLEPLAAGLRSKAWDSHPTTSVIRAIALQKEGTVDASLSAGDTAVILGAAHFLLGTLDDVARPVLAAEIPSTNNESVLIADVGANVLCKASQLVSFAKLAHEFRHKSGKSVKRIALLNIGTEPNKGTPTVIEADALLREMLPNYGGFIEANRVLVGDADIVICDGFAGNVLLKALESFYPLLKGLIASSNGREAITCDLEKFDTHTYGAAPLLGIRGVVFKAHGAATSRAFANGFRATMQAVAQKTAV